MPLKITDSDNISTLHTTERLQANLAAAKEIVEDIIIEVYFTVETRLPSGKLAGQPYWDSEPLRISCKGNAKLTEAMKTIQEAIGVERNKQQLAKKPII